MAVRRIGDNSTARRVVTNLGRVLVTIDDLRALRTLMTDLERVPGYDSPPEMGFKGGEFDNPDELVELSDDELRSIWLRSPNVEIELSARTATAIGRKDIAEAVYQRWARSRQTGEVPAEIRKDRRLSYIAGSLCISMVAVITFLKLDSMAEDDMPGVVALIVVGMAAIIFCMRPTAWGPLKSYRSYAVVRSVTLNEYRSSRTESQRHWRTIAMSAIAATIALAAVVLGLLFKK